MKIRTLAATIGTAALLLGVQVQAQQQTQDGGETPPRAIGDSRDGMRHGGPGRGGRFMRQHDGAARGMMQGAGRGAAVQRDSNGDGMIDASEFLAGLDDAPALVLEHRDANGDGMLSREELTPPARPQRPGADRAAMQACMQDAHPDFAGGASLEQRFDTLDSNDDSLLDATELAAGREARAQEQFTRLDTDADGLLTPDELRAGRTERRELRRALHECRSEAAQSSAP